MPFCFLQVHFTFRSFYLAPVKKSAIESLNHLFSCCSCRSAATLRTCCVSVRFAVRTVLTQCSVRTGQMVVASVSSPSAVRPPRAGALFLRLSVWNHCISPSSPPFFTLPTLSSVPKHTMKIYGERIAVNSPIHSLQSKDSHHRVCFSLLIALTSSYFMMTAVPCFLLRVSFPYFLSQSFVRVRNYKVYEWCS